MDERLVRQHLERLEDAYFQRFDLEQAAEHVRRLAALGRDHPVELIVEGEPGSLAATVLAFDHPSLFSLLCGTLAGMGFSIEAGDVFTYGPSGETAEAPRRAGGFRRRKPVFDPTRKRRIIDRFIGRLDDPDVDAEAFEARLRDAIEGLLESLEKDPDGGLAKARHRVNEMVTHRLGRLAEQTSPVLYPIELEINTDYSHRTYLRIVAQDTPAFLYALSNALSLVGMSIERVRIDTRDDRVEDEIGFVDRQGQAVRDRQALDRVKLVVLLTKQFTYYLDQSPDPYTALSRFERIVEDLLRQEGAEQWLDMLSDPRAMRHLARLLGASDYLWEEFIRLQYEALMPILKRRISDQPYAHDSRTIRTRLAQELARASTPSEKRKALNRFKDQEVFLIDLDHILRADSHFQEFSQKLTALAEAVVDAASDLAWRSLVEQHGKPRKEDGGPAEWAVFGLGKLGGAALGYASDIELMFVYDGGGTTDGRESIHTGEFFNLLAREVSRSIEAKQEGIFRVDLRVRPYGKNAPLACSFETFERYYSEDGDAHSWERMALVRLRPVAGEEAFGQRVARRRDGLVYGSGAIKLQELWEMRRMQWRQKRRKSGEFNAKYSPGALVDVEYSVQILQVRHGGEHPELRTPRVHKALAALVKVGAIERVDAETLRGCYGFLRKLINGLRMLRGSAEDLFVPPSDSPEFRHLARRMGYRADDGDEAEMLASDIERNRSAVQSFVRTTFGPDALPEGTGAG